MKDRRLPIATISSSPLRRAAMLIAFPVLIAWYFNWRLIALPFAIFWNGLAAAARAFSDSILNDLNSRSLRLLAAAWRKMWNEPLG